jgi:hypothetical protein
MAVFICHSSRDDVAVRSLVQHLRAARESVWLDQSLLGGDDWWSRILHQIRSCTVFLVAMSNNSLQSKPCRAEMSYAKALGLPILPVLIGDVDSYRIDPIFTVQSVEYRSPDVTSGMALIAALHERAGTRVELPDPLPEPPPIPYEYLQRIGVAIDSPEDLTPTEQSTMLLELRRVFRDENDETVHEDIRRLLRALRRRSEVTHAAAADIDDLLGASSGKDAQQGKGAGTTSPHSENAAQGTRGNAGAATASAREAGSLGQAVGPTASTAPRGRISPKAAALVAGAVVVAIVGFLVIVRTSHSTSPEPSATRSSEVSSLSSPEVSVSAPPVGTPTSPVAAMLGEWEGSAQTSDGNTFPIELKIDTDCQLSQLCGTIGVPQVPCYGQIFLNGVDNGEVDFNVANFDARSDHERCREGAGETFKLLPDGHLAYQTTYQPTAQGVLQKR